MSLSAAESKALWTSVQTHDLATYKRVYNSLLPQLFRNIPMRIYLPSATTGHSASIKVVQAHISPFLSRAASGGNNNQTPQTLGSALHSLLPKLFLSSKSENAVLARTILHGASLPLDSDLEDLARYAAYADGWLCVVILADT